MSAPPSPRIGHSPKRNSSTKKRDRPEALEIPGEDRKAVSDGEIRYEREYLVPEDKNTEEVIYNSAFSEGTSLIVAQRQQFTLNVTIPDGTPMEREQTLSRPTSSTSSLDPYYFGIQSESESPSAPLPSANTYLTATTPDHQRPIEPTTPARNPAAIDRRGLVGVGELATPRWAREGSTDRDDTVLDAEAEGYDVVPNDGEEEDHPDSPWTIEAIDGESSEREEVSNLQPHLQPPPRTLRTRPSIADESGGEEILYPRNIHSSVQAKEDIGSTLADDTPKFSHPPEYSSPDVNTVGLSPPSAFNPSARKTRKRTSGEFELDQTGTLTTKSPISSSSTRDKPKDDRSARKHRSLNISTVSPRESKTKERRRDSSGLTITSSIKTAPLPGKTPERHIRQSSASSTTSNAPESHHSRRVHTTDFSHLPPSPSSSSIQQFLRTTAGATASQPSSLHRSSKDNLQAHSSPNVAHALLRGNHEGWNLDDEATAEAFRKLDGMVGKGARARASVGSFGRPSSSSRPGTPASKSGSQWEGISTSDSGKSKRGSGNVKDGASSKDKGEFSLQDLVEPSVAAVSSDEQPQSQPPLDKTPKKANASARLSFTPKRGSTSSTTYASTPSSRDSASMSAATSVTSVSAASGRHSSNKGRRNSASSDVSSIHSTDASHSALNGDSTEVKVVPPVPPLPKDLSTYRSPPSTSSGLTFPVLPTDDKIYTSEIQLQPHRNASLEAPPSYTSPVVSPAASSSTRRESQHYSSTNESSPAVPKTPSKKWSFSALNLKLSGSPSNQKTSSFPLSPRSVTFGQQGRKSLSKEQPTSSSSASAPWSPNHPDAMTSAGSLTSLSSVGSVRTPAQMPSLSKTPDRAPQTSRPGTGSSTHTTSGLTAPPPGPLSPSSSIRRGQNKRLTPSSIPFFRRSSSQSMQVPPPTGPNPSSSPPVPGLLSANQSYMKQSTSPSQDYSSISTSTPGAAHKKSSMLSLGLPSLLKSSSRRSLHSDAKDAAKEQQRVKDAARESEKERIKLEKERQKKEDKDRSESRISVIMNRKRGKTLSSADPRKPKSPVNLPPMQIAALEPVTAQRVAKLKSNAIPVSSTSSRTSTSSSSSRLTNQTVSSMQKQSDTSLRSRNQLPTIAGSPSVGTTGTSSSQTLKEGREPPSTLMNSTSGLPKETPTKIPRISSRTSAVASPPLKNSTSTPAARRASNLAVASSNNASPVSLSTNEFGVIENEDGATPKVRQSTVRASPSASNASISRVPRQSTISGSINAPQSSATTPRKPNRDSMSFIGLRKSSTNSVASLSGTGNGLKLLAPKSSTRASTSGLNQSIHQPSASPSSSRQSLSTPSPAPSSPDEEELIGDEEMLHYIKRQHAKKLAAGASQEELDEMLKFPEPVPPGTPSSPASILKSSQAQSLSEFERKEILDYPSVYCIGANSRKKLAVLDNPTNNYGYDDERGDYLVVNHDHLAYRYEIIDTLGKGSFGQVLHCRDHCTGESMAVKIIRNKKRFHHQALVEIKILDNLRKWDADEKHHVIKMTEHFYFRNHLCIAMELLSINLYELIKANGFVGFTTALIRRFTSQMLLSLSLMRHHRIVHCDLKPENVLLRHPAKSGIKVIDFGSSCFEHEKIYTYIQSRFYRSPEVILGMNYHMAIDMWSLGCILAELYTGFPIFPGENEQEQLACIMEVLGVPDKEFINRSSRRKLFFDTNGAPRIVQNSKGRKRKPGTKTLASVLRCNDEEFVDFVAKCLIWDPERRMKPQTAMRHPFILAGRKPKPVTTTTRPSASSSNLSTRGKSTVTETPKKSLISAPTPLTARTTRTTTTNGGPTTPIQLDKQVTA
ncbi:Dual specificity tyrosine-phosphorylation-regulated kinase 4 [Psilocybe cubensis]|uniref:Dual specificity tyrosine-phosphorylation-regulated kinase 4 n=1 Tax=Psilocybe cubensis TaxID=181762 RepID=A0ACB8H7N8_PSICU|nr:Dual specificity tyrosine-phosphorylation-regulated kinase 4 [Psilocybe cubensis]KAH9483849.1 Dual specificity tyrosine-phosphorylation-regulated kinase 4 [Psilocybe cubensis]